MHAVTLSWEPNPEADVAGYRVFWGAVAAPASVIDVGTNTEATITGFAPGQRYYLYVTCYSTFGLESEPSDPVFYTPGESVPAAPSTLTGVFEAPNEITLHWSDNSGNELGFMLMRRTASETTYTPISIPANTTSYTESGLDPKTRYFYKLCAYNDAGESQPSTEINVLTPPGTGYAQFVSTDIQTSGSWRATYGREGAFAYPYGSFVRPSYVQISAYLNFPLVWANPSSDPRALQKASTSERMATAWHSTNFLNFYFQFTDARTHQLSFYFLDFDQAGRRQSVEFFDNDTGAFLGGTTISNFQSGVYSTWNLHGKVRMKLTTLSGPDCVLSGIFFDPPRLQRNSATLVRTDESTSGSWRGAYGGRGGFAYPYGYFVPPANLRIGALWNYPIVWMLSTTDSRALQRATGADRFAAAWHSSDYLEFYLRFNDTITHEISFYFLDFERLGRKQRLEMFDYETGEFLGSTMISDFENGTYCTWHVRGKVRLRLSRVTGPDCVLSGIFFDDVAGGSASFSRTDAETSGSWRGAYGTDGAIAYPYGYFTLPSYVKFNAYQNYPLVWNFFTTDTRALQRTSGTDRFAAAWNSTNYIDFYFRFNDSATHQISFYFLDYERLGRQEKLELFDDVSGKLLASTTISDFQNGTYSCWNLRGRVRARVSRLSGPNCVLSGIFFDPTGPDAALFAGADLTTFGAWKGTYGAQGEIIAAETPDLPLFASVAFSGASSWIWQASSTDLAALERPFQPTRVASTWFGSAPFTVFLNFYDAAFHRVSLYFVDYEGWGRQQRVEILDRDGTILDSTELSSFGSGVWLKYDLRGQVRVRLTPLLGPDAVLSGAFFE
jgi:hypothetical protein